MKAFSKEKSLNFWRTFKLYVCKRLLEAIQLEGKLRVVDGSTNQLIEVEIEADAQLTIKMNLSNVGKE